MTHEEIKDQVAEKAGLSKKQAEDAIKFYIETIEDALIVNHEARILGLGTLKLKKRAQRNGVNPRTKEKLVIPESIGIKLNVSKTLSTKVAERVELASF